MSDNDMDTSTAESGKPPLASKTPAKKATEADTAGNPLGISPPGMKLRSGAKKQPTPLKKTGGSSTPMKSNKKRRRPDDDDASASEVDDDASVDSVSKRTRSAVKSARKRRALEPVEEEEKESQNDAPMQSITVIDAVPEEAKDVDMDDVNKKEDNAEKDDESMDEDEKETDKESQEQDLQLNDSITDAVETTLRNEIEKEKVDNSKRDSTMFYKETNDAIASINDASQQVASPDHIDSPPPSAIQGLRLPSQHTPAPKKIDVGYHGKNKLKDFATPAPKKPSSDNGTDSEVEKMDLTKPQGVEVEEEEAERHEGRRDGLFHSIERNEEIEMTKTVVPIKSDAKAVFFLALGAIFLHVLLAISIGTGELVNDLISIRPFMIWNDFSVVTNDTIAFYRDIGVVPPPPEPVIPDPIIEEKIEYETVIFDNTELEQRERELQRARKVLNWWQEEKKTIQDNIETFQKKLHGHPDFLSEANEKLDSKSSQVMEKIYANNGIIESLSSAANDLKRVAETDTKIANIFDDVLELTGQELSDDRFQMHSYDHIHIPGEACESKEFIIKVESEAVDYATQEDVDASLTKIESHITSVFTNIRYVAEFYEPIKEFIDNALDGKFKELGLGTPPDIEGIDVVKVERNTQATQTTGGLEISQVETLIREQIEIAKADRTGMHDFASIRSGASVIYDGFRKTSPSLKENLPLGNQLMAKVGLRFYGHGPEAALQPTVPNGALGQCWSFEKEGDRKKITIKEWDDSSELEDERNRGDYATLAIRLSKPVYVNSIAIEHVPSSISSNRSSAIKDFRIYGFADKDASGEPWELGSGSYYAEQSSYQEFEMSKELSNGMPIPMIESIVLAIDSNWSAEYSCLYRFRVHGDEED